MKHFSGTRVPTTALIVVGATAWLAGISGASVLNGPPPPVPATQPPADPNAPGAGLAPRPDLPPGSKTPPLPRCTVNGRAGNDVLRGTAKPEVLCGLSGNDNLYARGSDILVGGPGNDILYARNGAPDFVVGGPGRDRAFVDPSGIDKLVGVERTGGARKLAHSGREAAFPIGNQGWFQHQRVGRLFFTGGRGFCSGSLVAANIVLTAAHCVYTTSAAGGICLVGGGGAFNADYANGGVTFVPGLWGQSKPYGEFRSRAATLSVPYSSEFDSCRQTDPIAAPPQAYYSTYDYAFIVLNPNSNGQNAGNVVGGWFTIAPEYQGAWYWSLGYPSQGYFATWAGTYPYFCHSKHFGTAQAAASDGSVGWDLGIGCTSTGGSSGGPWIVDANNDGVWTEVAGLNSHGNSDNAGLGINMWSPYFSRAILDLFNHATTL